jgi:hypothetical protein
LIADFCKDEKDVKSYRIIICKIYCDEKYTRQEENRDDEKTIYPNKGVL